MDKGIDNLYITASYTDFDGKIIAQVCQKSKSKNKKATRASAKIAVKLNLATTFLWWLFDTQKAKKSPARGGAKMLFICIYPEQLCTRGS